MTDEVQEEDYESPAEHPPRKVSKDDRFDFNVTSDDLSRYMEGETPANTEKSTAWAVNTFEAWRKARNKQHL